MSEDFHGMLLRGFNEAEDRVGLNQALELVERDSLGQRLPPFPPPLSISSATRGRDGFGSGFLPNGEETGVAVAPTKSTGGPGVNDSPTGTPEISASSSVPVYVMLPLDTVNAEGVFKYKSSPWFLQTLQELISSGIHGVAVDVWWGAVEKKPRLYDFSGYEELFEFLISLGLKIQVVLAFHACGGNVGDTAVVPLPSWVLSSGERDPDIFYTDRPRQQSPGNRNPECISLFADDEAGILRGRSPLQCYVDFMKAFRDAFLSKGSGTTESISEVVLGTGPCGELRYPSYAETNGWRFPGIGEFQCYDRRALASLASAAEACGRPEWGHGGPEGVGDYNSTPDETVFFRRWDGTWETEYGQFFLEWYSQALLDHGERMLQAAASVFNILDLKTPRGRTSNGTSGTNGTNGTNGIVGGICKTNNSQKDPTSPNSVTSDRTDHSESGLSLQESELTELTDAMDLSQHGGNISVSLLDTNHVEALQRQGSLGRDRGERGGSGERSGSGTLPERVPERAPSGGFAKSRGPSYASFKSSASVSDGLNSMEEWVWPTPSGKRVNINLKIAGVHWWYHTKSRPAELTAGYRGYDGIINLCAKYGVGLTLTCVEMCDAQHPPEALCGPEGLLREVKESACLVGVPLAGENALPCFMPNAIDESALQRIVYNTQPRAVDVDEEILADDGGVVGHMDAYIRRASSSTTSSGSWRMDNGPMGATATTTNDTLNATNGKHGAARLQVDDESGSPKSGNLLPPMRSFTFLRLTPDMIASDTDQSQWKQFMKLMSRNALRFKTSERGWRRDLGFHHDTEDAAMGTTNTLR